MTEFSLTKICDKTRRTLQRYRKRQVGFGPNRRDTEGATSLKSAKYENSILLFFFEKMAIRHSRRDFLVCVRVWKCVVFFCFFFFIF